MRTTPHTLPPASFSPNNAMLGVVSIWHAVTCHAGAGEPPDAAAARLRRLTAAARVRALERLAGRRAGQRTFQPQP